MNNVLLSSLAFYVTNKIPASDVDNKTYIGVDNMLPNCGGITVSDYAPCEGYVTKFMAGDILIGNIRPYFKKIWRATFEGGCSNDVLVIRSNGTVSSKYLYACLATQHFFDYDLAGSKGSKMPRGDKNHIMQYTVPLLDSETEIGDFIDDINSKILLNNSICSDLESLAKTIYDYWFLQFEFPNEDGKPYKSSGGKMVWNEELKREIPEGWNMCDIQDCCEIIDCLHSKKPEYKYDNENSYLLTLDNLTPDGNIDISKKYYISNRDFLKWTSKITVSENDFVVTNAGRAGDVCKIPAGVKCAIGRNITAIHPVEINPYYLRQYFKSGYFSQQVKKNLDCGSFFMSFNVKSIKVLKILMPKASIYNTYIDIIIPIIQTIESKIQENKELASLRDFLLPMLMNGQVTFKD